MKKQIASLLVLTMVAGLFGCSFRSAVREPVEFYYLRDSFLYGASDGVITSEARERSGHGDDLAYLLSLYLRGPLDEELKSPFPADCRLVDLRLDNKTLRLTLDASFIQLEGIDLTLACACLSKTCFGLTDVQTVKVEAAVPDENSAFNITFTRDSLLLEDTGMETLPSEAGEKN